MAFQPPQAIPKLESEAARVILQAFRAIGVDIAALSVPTLRVTPLKTGNYSPSPGELVRVVPPAAGMQILLPKATTANDDEHIFIAIESVASGGSVTVSAVGGQLINAASSITLTTVGLTDIASLGLSGWCATAGGGGGLTPPVALGSLANAPADTVVGNRTAAPAAHVDVTLASLAGTGLTYNAATHKFDTTGASGIVTGNATLNFGNAPGTNVVSVAVADAGIVAGSNVQAWIQGNDSTATHNAVEHQMLPLGPLSLAAISITPGVGFTLQAMTPLRVRGTFLARWARS